MCEWAYRVQFGRVLDVRKGIHARIKWGHPHEFCRAIGSMVEARMRLRGYNARAIHDYCAQETRIGALGDTRLTDLFKQRLIAETRAAIRECHRIHRANQATLTRAA